MTLTDAGPLVALIDAGEPDHDRCREALEVLPRPLLTTWPAFTEAMYLLGRSGWRGEGALWALVDRGALVIADLDAPAAARSAALMDRYADRPMDLADATLVALAEVRGLRTVFTLDDDFSIYRLKGRGTFTRVP